MSVRESRIAFIGFFSLFFFGGVWCYVKLCLFKPNSWMRRADYMSTSHAFLALGICLASVTSYIFRLALTPSAQVMMKFVFGDGHMFSLSSCRTQYYLFAIEAMSNVWHLFSSPSSQNIITPDDEPYLLFNFVLLLWLIKFLLYPLRCWHCQHARDEKTNSQI